MSTRWRIAAALVLVPALALVCVSCESEAVDTPGRGKGSPGKVEKPSSKQVVFVGEGFERIRIEAENAEKIESDQASDGKPLMRIVEAEGASGGKALFIPDKGGTPTPGSSGKEPKFARAVYRFQIDKAGLYTFWLRRKWGDPPACSDTFAVRFDKAGQPRRLGKTEDICGSDDMSRPPRWGWSPVWVNGQPKRTFLTAGEHVLELLNLEDGPYADVILLTNDRDYVPQGMEE
ncbi:MAG: hypothetical protein ACODAJ_03485 [Planctomycetota bacterium]